MKCTNKSCTRPRVEGKSECVSCRESHRKSARKRYDANRAKLNRATILRRHKVTAEEYEQMMAQQGGVCVICKQPCGHYSRLSIDHDHISGKVRGLLCNNCNRAIGMFGDDPARLVRAVEYLANASLA